MPYKNIARDGYQSLAGAWDLGSGVRMTFHIEDPRAERFTIEIFGPTTQNMRDISRIEAVTGTRLRGPSAGEAGANLLPQLAGRGAAIIAITNMIRVAASLNDQKSYTRVLRSAFALGAPIYHGSDIEDERKRDKIEAALRGRGTRGLGNLSWVARHYMHVLDAGPYFVEDGGRRWWEAGFIAVPQSIPAAVGSSATIPTDVLLRVWTDLYGTSLRMQLFATHNHEVIDQAEGVYQRAGDILYNPDDVQVIEAWQ